MTAAPPTSELAAFVTRMLDADEAAARAARHGGDGRWASWNRSWDAEPYRDLVDESNADRMARLPLWLDEHIARHDPARVLAQVAALRAVVGLGPSECAGRRDAIDIAIGGLDLKAMTHYPDEGWGFCDGCAAAESADATWRDTLRHLAAIWASNPAFDPAWSA